MFKNHHVGTEWNYEEHDRTYVKVGAYDIDDVEYQTQSDGSVFIPESQRYFTTLQIAYTSLNAEWVEHEWAMQ